MRIPLGFPMPFNLSNQQHRCYISAICLLLTAVQVSSVQWCGNSNKKGKDNEYIYMYVFMVHIQGTIKKRSRSIHYVTEDFPSQTLLRVRLPTMYLPVCLINQNMLLFDSASRLLGGFWLSLGSEIIKIDFQPILATIPYLLKKKNLNKIAMAILFYMPHW